MSDPDPDDAQIHRWLYERRDRLPIWTVYDHPTDFPDHYVARLFLSLPQPQPTDLMMSSQELEPIRFRLAALGFTPMQRSPEDDAKIMETWI